MLHSEPTVLPSNAGRARHADRRPPPHQPALHVLAARLVHRRPGHRHSTCSPRCRRAARPLPAGRARHLAAVRAHHVLRATPSGHMREAQAADPGALWRADTGGLRQRDRASSSSMDETIAPRQFANLVVGAVTDVAAPRTPYVNVCQAGVVPSGSPWGWMLSNALARLPCACGTVPRLGPPGSEVLP